MMEPVLVRILSQGVSTTESNEYNKPIVDDEDEYGHQDGNAQAAPADDGAQRGSDEKEHHAGQ